MATNNNLIPINIKDLPKLDILSNSDLIPIETVEGTATILYRDFIIDEAHTTFAATLSASVTSAVNLSAAIDTTNATVKTVSASLYSSITALSSSSFAYSNALSSSIVSLNATVTALSAYVNIVSLSAANNASNIASLSSAVNGFRTTVVAVTGSLPTSFVLSTGSTERGTTIEPFFIPPNAIFALESSKAYRFLYNLIYTKTSGAGTVTFTLSCNSSMNNIAGRIIHGPTTSSDTRFGTISGALIIDTNQFTESFPATPSLVDAQKQFADINVIIQTGTATNATLAVTCGAGGVTPLVGSVCTVTKLN
jgi:hypothetical protein